MTGPIRQRRLVAVTAYITIGILILFFQLVPLSPGKPGTTAPDLTLCLTLAWILRRPDQLPAIVIAGVILVGDIMLSRPFGLWSFFVLTGTELLRPRAQPWTDQAFVFEWLRVSALMGLMMLGFRLMMIVFLLPVPALGPVALYWLTTVIAYPLIVAIIHVIGVRRLSAAEIEMMVH
ncbi:MAG: rod shape-determining protein MreD [Paracoccus sp. (in: a-proteobacteria)]